MSDAGPKQPRVGAQDFREAFAHWRLAVHTEVKRASSLPTAMFDATDPMLEMRLAESTETLLAQLQRPNPNVEDASQQRTRRLEKISLDELRRLPRRIAEGDGQAVDLLADLGSEYIAVLADACCSADETIRDRAARHMCTDFGITATTIDATMRDLLELTCAVDCPHAASRQPEEIETTVRRVAEVLHTGGTAPGGGGRP